MKKLCLARKVARSESFDPFETGKNLTPNVAVLAAVPPNLHTIIWFGDSRAFKMTLIKASSLFETDFAARSVISSETTVLCHKILSQPTSFGVPSEVFQKYSRKLFADSWVLLRDPFTYPTPCKIWLLRVSLDSYRPQSENSEVSCVFAAFAYFLLAPWITSGNHNEAANTHHGPL